jgi:hypothetical protein
VNRPIDRAGRYKSFFRKGPPIGGDDGPRTLMGKRGWFISYHDVPRADRSPAIAQEYIPVRATSSDSPGRPPASSGSRAEAVHPQTSTPSRRASVSESSRSAAIVAAINGVHEQILRGTQAPNPELATQISHRTSAYACDMLGKCVGADSPEAKRAYTLLGYCDALNEAARKGQVTETLDQGIIRTSGTNDSSYRGARDLLQRAMYGPDGTLAQRLDLNTVLREDT